jgi:hypothetical protein
MPRDLRLCRWSERDLTFWALVEGVTVPVARLTFEVGPLGPYAGLVGSPIRSHALELERAWVRRGELPEAADPLVGEVSRWN